LGQRRRKEAGCVLTLVLVAIHVVVSFGLILFILLHSGRGGGLSDMFGGSVGSAAAGSTVVERNLDRITVSLAVLFTFTTLSLAIRLQ
jgi:preprotein translocase subunit SecG